MKCGGGGKIAADEVREVMGVLKATIRTLVFSGLQWLSGRYELGFTRITFAAVGAEVDLASLVRC